MEEEYIEVERGQHVKILSKEEIQQRYTKLVGSLNDTISIQIEPTEYDFTATSSSGDAFDKIGTDFKPVFRTHK